MAVAIAQALNCPAAAVSGDAADACGVCPTCSRIVRELYPDVQMIIPAENGSIKVEQVRDAIAQTMYRPFEGKRRIVIIDDADALGGAGQNALLKTLEEPPPTSIFILVTSRPDALLDTVRSRCAIIRFARLSPSDVAAVLQRDHGYAARDAQAVAAAAEGSVGQALAAHAGDLAEAREAVESLLVQSQGRSDARGRLEWTKALAKGGPVSSEREYLGMQLQVLASLVRDAALLRSGAREELLANVDRTPALAFVAKSLDGNRAVRVFSALDRAAAALDRNVSPKVVADWMMLQL